MANKKKHIDDLFKDNLQGSQLPLDGSEWAKLAGELHPEKKKRFVWLWFGIGILLLSASGLLYYNMNSTSLANQTEVQNQVDIETKREFCVHPWMGEGDSVDTAVCTFRLQRFLSFFVLPAIPSSMYVVCIPHHNVRMYACPGKFCRSG